MFSDAFCPQCSCRMDVLLSGHMYESAAVKRGLFFQESARQGTKVVQSYTRPAGGAVSVAGVPVFPL